MCGSMVDIKFATAEIRRGKTERKKMAEDTSNHRTKMSASAMEGGHTNRQDGPNVQCSCNV